MIPRKIHYCWFGNRPIPNKLEKYLNTWQKYCPDYEIKLWSEKNFDVYSHPFTKRAYENNKFAFVSDYVRAYALYNEGGVYLDTDVELKQNLNIFLENEAFSGFELRGSPISAVWGSIAKHSLIDELLRYYDSVVFSVEQEPNTRTISNILVKNFSIDPKKNCLQIGNNGKNTIHIYPAEYFCLDQLPNYATHHFEGSWLEDKNISTKEYIHLQHLADEIIETPLGKEYTLNAIAKRLTITEILKVFIFKCYALLKNTLK